MINGTKIKIDSRRVEPGDIFVAIKGTSEDGHAYIKEALEKGAGKIICEHYVEGLTESEKEKLAITKSSRTALGIKLKELFKDPSSKLITYGVTGTNGKTTTVYLIDSVLSSSGIKSGFISTVSVKSSATEKSKITTPDIISLNKYLAEMFLSGKTDAVIEISSHALSQERVSGIGLDYAVFTNLTPEHMDYHGNMESYFAAKARIFDTLKEKGKAVINIDDARINALKGKFPRCTTFGRDISADIRAENITYSGKGTDFLLKTKKYGDINISAKLIGEHNVYNILSAAGCLLNRGLTLDMVRKGIEEFNGVPGRLQEISSKAPFRVLVDYAHTPVALENVLKSVKGVSKGNIICVFGCGGDRDKEKRPVMGKIVTSLADEAIITNDNPRNEEPDEVIRQIEKGIENGNYTVISDRLEAIKEAFKRAGKDDVIIIAGKGHEDYQIIGERRYPFDDAEVSRNILKEMNF